MVDSIPDFNRLVIVGNQSKYRGLLFEKIIYSIYGLHFVI